jgi:hypothetical protein
MSFIVKQKKLESMFACMNLYSYRDNEGRY